MGGGVSVKNMYFNNYRIYNVYWDKVEGYLENFGKSANRSGTFPNQWHFSLVKVPIEMALFLIVVFDWQKCHFTIGKSSTTNGTFTNR